MKLIARVSTILVLSALVGCSSIIGPNAPHYMMKTNEVNDDPNNEVWTVFLNIEEAQKRLINAEAVSRKKALAVLRGLDANNDATFVSLAGGAIAGATGSLDGARIGTGLAALLGIAPDRYKLDNQRENLEKVADAYACLGDAIRGLTTTQLETPVLPIDEKVDVIALNKTRRNLVQDVSKAARDIENAFLKAMSAVKVAQPDLKAFEKATQTKQTDEANLPEVQRNLQSRFMKSLASNSTLAPMVAQQDLDQILKSREILMLRRQSLAITIELAKREGKAEVDGKKLDDLKDDLRVMNTRLVEAEKAVASIAATMLLTPTGVDTQALLVEKLTGLSATIIGCKATIAAK